MFGTYILITTFTKTKGQKMNATANKTLKELDVIMCEAIGVLYSDYEKMNCSEQYKVRMKYMKKVHNLSPKNHK